MQHLDEGTIHSWLDGALSAEEAARVQAHVAECPQCAAAVAEARGFIAASSRILTALDHVPRGVVPSPLPVRWYNRPALRAAAAVLVVGVGSLVVVRNSEQNKVAATSSMSDTRRTPVEAAAQSQTAPAAASPTATATSKLQAPPSVARPKRSVAVSAAGSGGNATAQANFSAKSVRVAAPSNVAARERARDEAADTTIGLSPAAAPQVAGVVTAAPQPALFSRAAGAATISEAAEPPPLKVVGTPRMIGAKVTLYEVAPGDTVTFIEASNVQLDAVAVTGMAAGEPQARRSAAKSGAAAAPARPPSPAVPTLQVAVENGVTTISWPDATTGNTLSLSGRMSAERLKEIRIRIERERAAAAKKKP